MKSIQNFFSSVSEACSPKKGTLSGAMDVIVIERPDGTLASTPFYVKFGRFKLLKSNNIKIDIVINDNYVNIPMELNKTGRAVFLRESVHKENENEIQQKNNADPEIASLLDNEYSSESDDNFINDLEVIANELEIPSNSLEISSTSLETPSTNLGTSSNIEISSKNSFDIINEEMKIDSNRKSMQFDEPIPAEINIEKNKDSINQKEIKNRPTWTYKSNLITENNSNELTSDELKLLNLKKGINFVNYVTQTNKRIFLFGRIFLWDYSSKIVISDIDGTLTKSDLMGHICYMIGKDWSRGGVASLYNSIIARGYKILYLSARSLGQVESTRGYLFFMNQEGEKLPEGPLILSPDSLFKTIVGEMRNLSQAFKEKALNELLQTFPVDFFPFYAGFGNKDGDAIAYTRMGIPSERIFILKSPNKKKKDEFSCINNFNEVALNFEDIFFKLN